MPPTRRPVAQRPLAKRRILRRRSRTSTWIDLLPSRNEQYAVKSSPGAPGLQPSAPRNVEQSFPSSETPNLIEPVLWCHTSDSCDSEEDVIASYSNCSPTPSTGSITDSPAAALDLNDGNTQHFLGEDNEIDLSEEVEAAATHFTNLFQARSRLLTPSNFIALTMLSGSVKFSVKQYELVRTVLKYAAEDFDLPSYSTVQRKLFPHLLENCFPRSTIASFPAVRGGGLRLQKTASFARIVFPTEWARIDVASFPYFENIFQNTTQRDRTDESHRIEDSPIVCHRDSFLNAAYYLFVEDQYGRIPAPAGEAISIEIANIPCGVSLDELQVNCDMRDPPRGISVQATIEATWCVGSRFNETESGKQALQKASSYFHPIILEMMKSPSHVKSTSDEVPRRRPRTVQRFFTHLLENDGSVLPGDICSLLIPNDFTTQGCTPPTICSVLISRCLKKYDGMASQFLIWIRLNLEEESDKAYSILDVQNLRSIPKLVHRPNQSPAKRDARYSGKLIDGRPYVIYRVMLYCDDFKESGSPYSKSSCGGVYLLPLGMSQKARRSRTAVHVISLTPPGVSTNEVLLKIIPDTVRGSTGIEGVLPSGEPVLIFLDVVGFIADYPAAAEPLDVLGHTADTPCTHCSIRKFKNNDSSTMGFTTLVHASNSASFRCGERHAALRESQLSNRETNMLGMKEQLTASTQKYPLSILRDELLSVRSAIPRTSENEPVLSGLFDPFRSSVIAPDHLLSGLARNVMDLCFRMLRPELRKDLDIAICSALCDNGLPRQRSVFNEKRIQLHSMSLSSVFCVLLVFHPVCMGFHLPEQEVIHESLFLLRTLNELIAMTYWSPSAATDGEEAFQLTRAEGGKTYHAFLQGLAERYVTEVDKFCSTRPELGCILDKPNLHRLLELYYHSIPAFGHVSLFQELVFETAHQPLKRSVTRGNHRNAECSAVLHCLGNDWQARLGMLYDRTHSDDADERELAHNGLLRLVLGNDLIASSRTRIGLSEKAVDCIQSSVKNCLSPPVVHAIQSNGNINAGLVGGNARWNTNSQGGPHRQGRIFVPSRVETLMRKARRVLHIHSGIFGKDEETLNIRWQANWVRPSTKGNIQSSTHDVLESGAVVQATIRRKDEYSTLVRPHATGDYKIAIFVVLGFLQENAEGPWAVCVRCEELHQDVIHIRKDFQASNIQLLQMSEGVRRTGIYHMCEFGETCSIERDTRNLQHSETPLTGGYFRIQKRSQGYPPRIA